MRTDGGWEKRWHPLREERVIVSAHRQDRPWIGETLTDGSDYRGFHFHAERDPPLRKPNLLKYLAGPEIGGGSFLSDTVPEEKARGLQAVPDAHYRRSPTS